MIERGRASLLGVLLLTCVVLLLVLTPTLASAEFPGHNGRILFTGRAVPERGIFSMRPNGGVVRWLGVGSQAAMSPNGDRIAFVAGDPGLSHYSQIFTMGSNGEDPTRITLMRGVDAVEPAWSPAGDRIVFCSDHVYAMDPDGSHLQQLTHLGTDGCEPAWSPDGDRIALDRNRRIVTVDTDGHDLRPVTPVEMSAYEPAWSPNGRRIAFVAVDSGASPTVYSLCTIRLDGSGLRTLAATSHYDENISGPAWSPDGRWIAYVITRHFYEANDTQAQTMFKIRANGTYRQWLIGGLHGHNDDPDWGVALSRT